MSAKRLLPVAIAALLAAPALYAQASDQSLPNAPGAPAIAPAPAVNPAEDNVPVDSVDTPQLAGLTSPPAIQDYESCDFGDGLQVVKNDAMPPGPQQRTITTLDGRRTLHMLAGRRILFAYGISGDYFANVKPELLPADTWATQKGYLLDEIQAMQRADFRMQPNTTLPAALHGLEVHGFDRDDLNGHTLGFYLLFDNQRHVATSIYFTNQDPIARRFQTIQQYRDLRTHFLNAYTACIQQNIQLRAPSEKAQP